MFFNNNFANTPFGYSIPENCDFDLNGHLFGLTDNGSLAQAAQADWPDFNDLTAAEIESWWMAPSPGGNVDQYTGSTPLDPSYDEFAEEHDPQPGPSSGHPNMANTSSVNVLRKNYVDEPECTWPPVPGPSTGPYPTGPVQPLAPPLATCPGLEVPYTLVPSLPWGYSTNPADTYATARNWLADEKPLAASNSCGRWRYATSVGEGKARATEDFPPIGPSDPCNTTLGYQQHYMPEAYDAGSNLQICAGFPVTNPPTQVAPSSEPQRSVRSAGEKGKGVENGGGRRKRTPRKDLPPGVNWPNTRDRFCAEMAKICLNQPTGEVTDPETAYACFIHFVTDDLHLSPLVARPLGERLCRDVEQYLSRVLNELRPQASGQKTGVRYVLERVAQELEDGLVVANDEPALQDGHTNEIDLDELDDSEVAVRRRAAEKERRESIRESLERMTLFLRVPKPSHLWTKPQVLFYAIVYILFGARVFGDGGKLFIPKPEP